MGRIAGHREEDTIKDRFYRLISKNPNGCWLWVGSLSSHGYGRLQYKKVRRAAHRISYEIHKGPIGDGLDICHTCDTPACVNPDHLFAGTRVDNMQDCLSKGRFRIGEGSPNARLREKDVKNIFKLRKAGLTHQAIADKIGIGRVQVTRILNGMRWSHVKVEV